MVMRCRRSVSLLCLAIVLPPPLAHGGFPAGEIKGRLISIERGEQDPIRLRGVRVTLRIKGPTGVEERIGAVAPTNENGRFAILLPSRSWEKQDLSLEQDSSNYGILYPRLGKLDASVQLDEDLEVRLLPRLSTKWLSDERLEDYLNSNDSYSWILRALSQQSGFSQERVQERFSDWVRKKPSGAGIEEFKIGIKAISKPGAEKRNVEILWRVELLSSPVDDSAPLKAPRSIELRPRVTRQDLDYLRHPPSRGPDPDRLRRIGDAVRESIFDAEFANALEKSLFIAKVRQSSLRLVVVLKGGGVAGDAISPAELPIEAIHFDETAILDEFPSTAPSFTVSRTLDEPLIAPRKVHYPLRILVVTPSPADMDDPQAKAQRAAIIDGLKGLAFDREGKPREDGPVQVAFCDPPTWEHFQTLLEDVRPHVVHFIGHGAFRNIFFERPKAEDRFDLQLMSWGDGSRVPNSGQKLVLAGTDNNGLLHIRIFDAGGVNTDIFETKDNSGALHLKSADASGDVLSDALESNLTTTQAGAISTLKQQLTDLLPPHVLTSIERGQVLSQATSIVGQIHQDSDAVGAEDLAHVLHDQDLRLVVLTACSGGASKAEDSDVPRDDVHSFGGTAQKLLHTRHVTAVVGMQFDLGIEAAMEISKVFYRSLLVDGHEIDVAVTQSRIRLADVYRIGRGVWITPVLYTRCLNGRIFEFPAQLGLAGIVTDAEQLRPIERVILQITDLKDIYGRTPEAVTDSAGQFRFQGLPPGEARRVNLVVRGSGYLVSRSTVELGETSLKIRLASDRPRSR